MKLKRILEFITVMRRMKTKHKKVGQPTVTIFENTKKSGKAQNTAFLKKAFETAAPLFERCGVACVHEKVAIADFECPLYGKTLLFDELMIK